MVQTTRQQMIRNVVRLLSAFRDIATGAARGWTRGGIGYSCSWMIQPVQYKTKCAKAAGSDGGANNRTPLQLHLTNGRTSDAVIAMIQYCSLLWHWIQLHDSNDRGGKSDTSQCEIYSIVTNTTYFLWQTQHIFVTKTTDFCGKHNRFFVTKTADFYPVPLFKVDISRYVIIILIYLF